MKYMQRRSLLLTAPKQLQWITETLPPLQPNEVLVQTTAGAISIGAELPQYRGMSRSSAPPTYPHMTGYESLGTIISCGSTVHHLRIGDRIVAFYGHRTHGIVAEQKAICVPQNISDAIALLSILTCDVSKGIMKMGSLADRILITGAGAIGLLTCFMLRYYRSGIIIDVVEPRAERRTLALLLGATTALPPEEMPGLNNSYRMAFECSSSNAAFELMQQKMQKDGRICILADGNIEPLILTPAFHEKELNIIGSSDGLDYPTHAKLFFDYVQKLATNLEQLFDYQTTADNLANAFANLANGTISPIKILVKYTC